MVDPKTQDGDSPTGDGTDAGDGLQAFLKNVSAKQKNASQLAKQMQEADQSQELKAYETVLSPKARKKFKKKHTGPWPMIMLGLFVALMVGGKIYKVWKGVRHSSSTEQSAARP